MHINSYVWRRPHLRGHGELGQEGGEPHLDKGLVELKNQSSPEKQDRHFREKKNLCF